MIIEIILLLVGGLFLGGIAILLGFIAAPIIAISKVLSQKTCPYCKKKIAKKANICIYCQKEQTK